MEDEGLDGQLRDLAGEGREETEVWRNGKRKRELVREVVGVVFGECGGDDVDIEPMGGGQAIAAVVAEDDESFDVAKK